MNDYVAAFLLLAGLVVAWVVTKFMEDEGVDRTCPDCTGDGFIMAGGFGIEPLKLTCARCNGLGLVVS